MTFLIDVPEDALRQLQMSPQELEQEVRLLLAARLYENGIASTGRAAELMGVSRALLLCRLGSFGIALFDLSPEELQRDLEHAALVPQRQNATVAPTQLPRGVQEMDPAGGTNHDPGT